MRPLSLIILDSETFHSTLNSKDFKWNLIHDIVKILSDVSNYLNGCFLENISIFRDGELQNEARDEIVNGIRVNVKYLFISYIVVVVGTQLYGVTGQTCRSIFISL